MKKEKNKLKYSAWTTVLFILKGIWRWDKALFVYFSSYTICNAIMPFVAIFLPKLVIDELTGAKRLYILFTLIGIAGIANFLLELLRDFSSSVYWPRIVMVRKEFIHKIDEKILSMDYRLVEDSGMQNLMQKAWRAVSDNYNGVEGIINRIFFTGSSFLTFIGYSAIIFTLNPLVLVFLLVGISAGHFASIIEMKKSYKANSEIAPYERKIRYLDRHLADFTYGKDIRLFNMGSWLIGYYSRLIKKIYYYEAIISKYKFGVDTFNGIFNLLRDGLVYGYLIYLVLQNKIGIGSFTMYFATVIGFSEWMKSVMDSIAYMRRQNLYINDYRAFVEYRDNAVNCKKCELPAGDQLPCSIEFDHVYFKYPGKSEYIIKDLNLKIEKGERVALVGTNGAGKTTLVKLLTGLYKPEKGRILINGTDNRDFDRDEYFRLFSVIFQDIKLYAFTLAENVALRIRNEINRELVREALVSAGLGEKLTSLKKGIDTAVLKNIETDGVEFSGGEIQKLALARALYKDAPVIILDEPTAALDALAEYELYKNFNSITRDKTAVFISHRLSSTRFCDKIIFLEDGTIVESGTHEELLGLKGKYADMFNIQAKYYNKDSNEGGEDYVETKSGDCLTAG